MTHPAFSRIIYALQEPVLLVDPRGTVVAANPGASRLFRRPSPGLVGKRLTTLVADDPDGLTEYLRQCSQNSAGLQSDLHIRLSYHQPITCTVMGGSGCKKQPHLVWVRLLPGNPNAHVADYNKRQSSVADRPRLLTVESRMDESGNVMVVIRDLGIGLCSKPHRVFSPFFTTKIHGMGMGWSISRFLVHSMGGRLWAEPNFPNGAVFFFTLPIADGVPDE